MRGVSPQDEQTRRTHKNWKEKMCELRYFFHMPLSCNVANVLTKATSPCKQVSMMLPSRQGHTPSDVFRQVERQEVRNSPLWSVKNRPNTQRTATVAMGAAFRFVRPEDKTASPQRVVRHALGPPPNPR